MTDEQKDARIEELERELDERNEMIDNLRDIMSECAELAEEMGDKLKDALKN